MNKEKHKLPKLTQEEIQNPNELITMRETEFSKYNDFTDEIYQC